VRVVAQRVASASVVVGEETVGAIDHGLLLFVGVEETDSEVDVNWLSAKLSKLRIFPDAAGVMNRNVSEVGGQVLAVSQFTLYADVRKGRRPSFIAAARPEQAEPLYQRFCSLLRAEGVAVQQGIFQAEMQVSLVNDGPVTIWMDSADLL